MFLPAADYERSAVGLRNRCHHASLHTYATTRCSSRARRHLVFGRRVEPCRLRLLGGITCGPASTLEQATLVAPELPYGKLPADQIVPALPKRVWFNSVGAPLSDNERSECEQYLRGLGLARWEIVILNSWDEAMARSGKANWFARWWDRERNEERKLFEAASQRHSPDTLLLRLANLMHGSATLFLSPASVACTRAGVMDSTIASAAAGAAAQSLHQYGLASITGQSEAHFFAAKFRLFLSGRWPVCVDEERFFVF